ncbi:AAA family ATPase [Enterococcus sp. JM9B]|uniref:AAA family ATPase n=1 Tax=Enterococcus sp. JM9B TaxID=1857216 RepID=UPI0013749D24|nr:AAA family ATPase [Enterococcus sp. JM9B]KAF1303509.1 hypothetical protein BAU16_03970 [Enterococcus sp. JM9B]
MSISIIDIEIDGVHIFKDEKFYINFRNESRVFEEEKENHVVSKLMGNNYRNNVVALAGINASGKTSSLYLINFIMMVFIMGEGLNFDKRIAALLNKEVTIKAHFISKKKIYYLKASITKEATVSGQVLNFKEEEVYSKVVNSQVTNKMFLDHSDFSEELVRSELLSSKSGAFLKEEDSVLPSFAQVDGLDVPRNYVLDTFSSTDMNFIYAFSKYDASIIQYLDDSIEHLEIEFNIEEKQAYFSLKFYNSEPIRGTLLNLRDYLSSGTIKGLSIFSYIKAILKNGGYLLVDELEIHFNKTIVENILSFFQSKANKNGATLVFSTHYSELLDKIERKETVKILRKKERKIQIDNLAELSEAEKKNRTDVKNSDLILSGIFGTAPSYEKYWKVYKNLLELTEGDSSEK